MKHNPSRNIPGITVKGYSKQQRSDYMKVIKRNNYGK